ncbi:MAG: FAD-dependent oxidoreductase [Actinomycetota bacterium]|nr:FAD-dependent oxidoreductase [Actinomycetota bacterium]
MPSSAPRAPPPRCRWPRSSACRCSPNGYIDTDIEQRTNVPGVYAAGDVTRIHGHQITTAVHEGATAASAANYYLYPPELKAD